MTLSCSSTDFENDSDFRPSRARCCLRFRLCRSIRCVYRLLITCSFPFRRDSYSGQPSVIHITTSKGDSRLIRRPSVAIVRSPNTCATTVFRSYRFNNRDEAISVIREYIEIFYNRQRRHSRLGNISPATFREKYHQMAA